MQGNDISAFIDSRQATMFEGVLAVPPMKALTKFREKVLTGDTEESWENRLRFWTPCTMPLKSMVDYVNRLGVMTEVYTFLSENAVDPISKWLIRKGVSVPVYYYPSVVELAFDLTFNRSIRRVFTSSSEDAQVLGIRSTVVTTEKAWG